MHLRKMYFAQANCNREEKEYRSIKMIFHFASKTQVSYLPRNQKT